METRNNKRKTPAQTNKARPRTGGAARPAQGAQRRPGPRGAARRTPAQGSARRTPAQGSTRRPVKRPYSTARRSRRQASIPAPLFITAGVLIILVLALLVPKLFPRKDTITVTPQDNIALNGDAATVQATQEPDELPEVFVVNDNNETEAQPTQPAQDTQDTQLAQPAQEEQNAVPVNTNFSYLPIYAKGNTSEKIIAITVDDCFQEGNLQTIIGYSEAAGGKLTIFPIGKNILKGNIGAILKDAALNKGYEIENHTFEHKRVFRLSDEEMCEQIWKQWAAVCTTFGVNYKQHFFRLNGGDGKEDQRTHAYLQQMGFNGIAYWSYSGSDAPLEDCKKRLAPGMVYLFHTTDRDTGVLKDFIPYVVSQGYRLVTLNTMFGLPDNEISDISTCNTTMPTLAPFAWDYKDIGKGDYSYRTWQIQNVLGSEGLLGEEAKEDGTWSGYYGGKTEAAVKTYQQNHGLNPTGVADRATQQTMLG